jgi:carboxyl-terminal processing protease
MRKIYFIIILIIFSVFSFTKTVKSQSESDFEMMKNIEIFIEIYKSLNANYVEDIQHGKIMKKAIDKMLADLDPYTVYIPESKMEDYKYMTTGQYGGIGAVIHKREDYVEIAEPYENSPAHKAGMEAGDLIIAIDGESAKDKSTSDVSEILKGQPKTEVKLLIRKAVSGEEKEITIIREEIKITDIPYYGMLNEHIGYIKLSGFTNNVSKEFKEAFVEMKKENNIDALVIDLRGNGGGLLNEAVSICNLFVKKGEEIVSTKGKLVDKNRVYRTSSNPVDKDIPLVVLIDGRSASASEIVSGAIQDLDRGVVIGEKTFGKGLVQNILSLDYNTKLKITVAKYYIPSGRCIQAIDYAHKDLNGKAQKVPDSLLVAFQTKNGRTVYDGAGIFPDIEVTQREYANISYQLITERIIFDFAGKFVAENPSITDARNFRITDEIYQEFVAFTADKDIDYETKTEKLLKELEEAAEEEKYEESIIKSMEELEKMVLKDKQEDLQKFREEIALLLKNEIVSRYYFQKGRVEAALDEDPVILKAIEVLENKDIYQSVLDGSFSAN